VAASPELLATLDTSGDPAEEGTAPGLPDQGRTVSPLLLAALIGGGLALLLLGLIIALKLTHHEGLEPIEPPAPLERIAH
jgi:hypothetical protein